MSMSDPGYKSFSLAGSTLGRGISILLIVYLVLSAPVLLVSLIIAVTSLFGAIITLNAAIAALLNVAFLVHIVGLLISIKPVSRHSWIWRWYALGALSELGLAALFWSVDNEALHQLFYIVVLLLPCAVISAVTSFNVGKASVSVL
jgi:hypothetical protein